MDSCLFYFIFCHHFSPHNKPNLISNHELLLILADHFTSVSRRSCWFSPYQKKETKVTQPSSQVSKGLKENYLLIVCAQIGSCVTVPHHTDSPTVISKIIREDVIHLLPSIILREEVKNSPLLQPLWNAVAICQHWSRCSTRHYTPDFISRVCVARPAPAFDWPHQTRLPAPVSSKNFFSLLVTLAISVPSMSLKARHSLCYPPELMRQGLLIQTGKTSTSLVSLNWARSRLRPTFPAKAHSCYWK